MKSSIRRNLMLLALAIGSYVVAACADVTGPKTPTPKQDCVIYQGTSTCS